MTVDVTSSPQRGLSLFLTIPADGEPARTYNQSLEVIRLAEELGYETAWAAEAHFTLIGLPSALTFLAAASQTTTTIRLGTAVVPLTFDNPIRLAETAALVDALSGERLEFGVGKSNGGGFSTVAFEAFNLSEDDRESLYAHALADLRRALGGTIAAGDKEVSVYPPPAGLLPRLWQATGNPRTAAEIGRAGDRLLLHRLVPSGDAGEVQAGLISDYLDAHTGERSPRIGISRVVLPAASKRDAIALLDSELRRNPGQYVTPGGPPATAEEFLTRSNVKYGDPDDVVEQLLQDAAFTRSTDYLFSVPLPQSSPQFRDGLRLIAQEIFPRLPAHDRAPTA
ncbi:flavin-dependent oxidoreductase, methylene-tetrahydromethanopterin reductase [Frankia torreyi]|uniref:Flavin-dependent oxidoreductase, methylene-tetrahydromethanopterin reductase n=1 Tax=Frankia torreyi TaxID=1856 RepID=A0A0D8BDP8_9ACTN|nr:MULTISPECIES: LLM class flavin-dependent oxidoreductase [Frankia]KJE22383.1 flavin-dependent oxidoreductase, methylene-tetrahydromethanopterin reductase [Frankia torreyi]KQC37496.1 monooxygenase [Frankia sp. ACN1ag]KQM04987.1 flavin-dependent oxidoreductase/methylene-tetrahydromethanopterin reductase [Frankia sp. CpI1-P]